MVDHQQIEYVAWDLPAKNWTPNVTVCVVVYECKHCDVYLPYKNSGHSCNGTDPDEGYEEEEVYHRRFRETVRRIMYERNPRIVLVFQCGGCDKYHSIEADEIDDSGEYSSDDEMEVQ